jgi:hypothetical protein
MITLKDIDKANFATAIGYNTKVNKLCRRLYKMVPEEGDGITLVSARVAVPNTTLGQVARLVQVEASKRTASVGYDRAEEHFLEIKVGEAVVEVFCIVEKN